MYIVNGQFKPLSDWKIDSVYNYAEGREEHFLVLSFLPYEYLKFRSHDEAQAEIKAMYDACVKAGVSERDLRRIEKLSPAEKHIYNKE